MPGQHLHSACLPESNSISTSSQEETKQGWGVFSHLHSLEKRAPSAAAQPAAVRGQKLQFVHLQILRGHILLLIYRRSFLVPVWIKVCISLLSGGFPEAEVVLPLLSATIWCRTTSPPDNSSWVHVAGISMFTPPRAHSTYDLWCKCVRKFSSAHPQADKKWTEARRQKIWTPSWCL